MKGFIVVVLILLSSVFLLPRVNAQAYFTVYPTEGNVTTDIFLQIRGLPGSGFYEVYYLYIFWDTSLLGMFPDNSQTYDHYFDTHFSPPNTGNQSALGNHTVYFEVWNYHRSAMFINATFVFTITEYLPNTEYLALNVTYYDLLSNYTALSTNYASLQTQYLTLSSNYNDLLSNYNSLFNSYSQLSGNYSGLLNAYNSLSSNYNNIVSRFNSLNSDYSRLNDNLESLNTTYKSLLDTYNALQANYGSLQGNYNSLNYNYNALQTNYNALVGETAITRNMGYLFAVTTMIFIATTIYFATRKPKQKQPAI